MKLRSLGAAAALAALLSAGVVHNATSSPSASVPGQKLDSGLGSLPHYSQWKDKSGANPTGAVVAGEKLDAGLGDLPHYSKWVDKSGRNPMGAAGPSYAAR